MFTYYFNIGLVYVLVGFASALFFVFVLKKRVIGNFWAALTVAVVGSFLGGVADLFLGNFLRDLANIADAVNIFPALFAAFLVLWLFSRFNRGE